MTFREKRKLLKNLIGKTVTMRVDRPYGSVRGKNRHAVYPINCGRVEAPAFYGGEIGAYLLGVNYPVGEYTGIVIGVVIHKNDSKDKIVLAPDNMLFNQAQIAEQVFFKEKYYQIEIDALYQKSCGGVVVRNNNGKKEYLILLQKRSGSWSLPKGHMEIDEDEVTTARREIFEETGILVDFIPGFREETEYKISNVKTKRVVFFLAITDETPSVGESEITGYVWLDAEETKKLLNTDYVQIIDKVEKMDLF